MVLSKFQEKLGLPDFHEVNEMLTGESGKRIDNILSRLEKLSSNAESLKSAIDLLKIVRDLNGNGGLEKLDSILTKLPRGKNQAATIAELSKLLAGLEAKLDKVADLAKMILNEED
jgi:hypothetical protein